MAKKAIQNTGKKNLTKFTSNVGTLLSEGKKQTKTDSQRLRTSAKMSSGNDVKKADRTKKEEIPQTVDNNVKMFGGKQKRTSGKRHIRERSRSLKYTKDLATAVLETAGALVIVLDEKGRIVTFNRACEDITGYTFEEVKNRVFWDFLLIPDEIRQVKSVFRKLRAGQFPNRFENYWVAKNGTRYLISWSNTALTNNKGEVEFIIGTGIDITVRRQAEQSLRESREDLNRAQAVAMTGSWRMNLQKNELLWSDQNHRIFGIPRGTPMTYETFLNTVHPDDRLHVDKKWSDALLGQLYDIEHRIIVGDTVKWVRERAELEFDKDGTLLGGFGTTQDITEKKKAEKALLESEQALRKAHEDLETKVQARTQEIREKAELIDSIFKHTITPLVLLDRRFNFIRVNQAYADVCAKDIDAFPGHNHFEFYPHEENEIIFKKVVETKEPYQVFAKPFIFPDHPEWGITHWDWTLTPLLDSSGEVNFLVFSLNDVTPRIKAQEKIKIERNRLKTILHTMPDGILIISRDYDIQYINPALEKDFGPVRTQKCYEYFHGRKNACYWCNNAEVLAGNTVRQEWKHETVGRIYELLSTPFLDDDGSVSKLQIFHDITLRKQAEKELRMSENKYRMLIEQASEGIALLTRELEIIDVNSMACQITGYSYEELLGKQTLEMLYPHELTRVTDAMEKVLLGETLILELLLKRKDGMPAVLDLSANVVEGDMIQVIFRDITEKKEREKQIHVTDTLLGLFAKTSSRKEYLRSVVQIIHEWTGCRCVGVRVADDRGFIPYESYTGFSQEFWQMENMLSLKSDVCACIRTVMGQFEPQDSSVLTPYGSVCINNSREFMKTLTEEEAKRFRGNCIRSGFLSIALVPIRYRETTIGLIHLADEHEGKAPLGAVQFLESLSSLIGEAIHRFNTEEALRKSKASLSEAQKIAHIGNWDWNIEKNELNWSDEIYRIFGVSQEKFAKTYEAFLDLVHPDDREAVQSAVSEAFFEKKPYSVDYRIILPAGIEKILQSRGEIVFGLNSVPLRMLGTIQDVTERKKTEEQLRSLFAHLQTVREKEREKIAREIHDEFGSMLTALKIDISWLEKKLSQSHPDTIKRLQRDLELLSSAIKTVHRISSELRPGTLDHLGLGAAVDWQVKEFGKRLGTKCHIDIDMQNEDIDRELSTSVFRILQESLTNIARHAKASSVSIMLRIKDHALHFEIIDDGRGITEKEINNPQSFGLMGIRERVEYMRGKVVIGRSPHGGTVLSVTIPLGTGV